MTAHSSLKSNRFFDAFAFSNRSIDRFRLLLALVGLLELTQRLGDLQAHYTDAGLFPRSFYSEGLGGLKWVLPHFWFATVTPLAILFAAHAALLIRLLFRRTLWVSCAVWFLTLSLHFRNPAVLTGGDTLYRIALFWNCFLPFFPGERRSGRVASGATLGLTLQMVIIYGAAALSKALSPLWIQGKIWASLLKDSERLTPLGQFSLRSLPLDSPSFTLGLSWVVIGVEALIALGILSSCRWSKIRKPALILAIGFHLALGVTLHLGWFPLQALGVLSILWFAQDGPVIETGSRGAAVFLIPIFVIQMNAALPPAVVAPFQSFAGASGLEQNWDFFNPKQPDPGELQFYSKTDTHPHALIEWPKNHRWLKAKDQICSWLLYEPALPRTTQIQKLLCAWYPRSSTLWIEDQEKTQLHEWNCHLPDARTD